MLPDKQCRSALSTTVMLMLLACALIGCLRPAQVHAVRQCHAQACDKTDCTSEPASRSKNKEASESHALHSLWQTVADCAMPAKQSGSGHLIRHVV